MFSSCFFFFFQLYSCRIVCVKHCLSVCKWNLYVFFCAFTYCSHLMANRRWNWVYLYMVWLKGIREKHFSTNQIYVSTNITLHYYYYHYYLCFVVVVYAGVECVDCRASSSWENTKYAVSDGVLVYFIPLLFFSFFFVFECFSNVLQIFIRTRSDWIFPVVY